MANNKGQGEEKMTKEKVCTLREDDYFDWCRGMKKMIHPFANDYVKGLVQVNLLNTRTGKGSCLGVSYRESAKSKAYKLMLNFCPWCGKEIINKKHL
jgi:hypothetical protein